MRKLLFVCALATLATACSNDSDDAMGPDSRNCTNGSIAIGDTKTGTIDDRSCATYDWYWEMDSVNFESYDVTVEKGKGYLFTLGGTETTTRSLALVSLNAAFGDSGSLFLTVQSNYNDDDAVPAQLFFVAPQSGTYSLRAFTDNLDDSFDYTLTARECTPRQLDITDEFTDEAATLTEDDCKVHESYFTWANRGGSWSYAPTHVALYTIHFDGYSNREITVTSNDFAPAMMVEGPGFDAWCNTDYCDGRSSSNAALADSVTDTFRMWMPGTYTLVVGSMMPNETGTFSVSVSEPRDPQLQALLLPKSWDALQPGQWKKMKAPR